MMRDRPLLPHLLMKKNDEDPDVASGEILLGPPHLLLKKQTASKEELSQGPCNLRLTANLSPISSPSVEKPTVFYNFIFQDRTKVVFPWQVDTGRYFLPCPFDSDRLSCHNFRIESSLFVRSEIPLNILPIEHRHREYFESEMTRFIHRNIEEAGGKYRVNVHVTASIEREIWHEEAPETAKKIEEELRSDENKDDTRSATSGGECAVCFEEVKMRRFEGTELECYHVFHVSCIAPWLAKNNTCPMCRRVQLVYLSI